MARPLWRSKLFRSLVSSILLLIAPLSFPAKSTSSDKSMFEAIGGVISWGARMQLTKEQTKVCLHSFVWSIKYLSFLAKGRSHG